MLSISVVKGLVVFRSCRFKGNGQGLVVTGIRDENGILYTEVRVIFENCIFDSSSNGALIDQDSKVDFLNCHFINNSKVVCYAAVAKLMFSHRHFQITL